ncbi:MAG: CPBP family intramembrane metalloprotease [Bacilli bacterium]|nr:CPBP family intramembrane metalloprotease [Bacilli bacterium]
MKKLITKYLKDIKMDDKNIRRKNIASIITIFTELLKVFLTILFINKLSFITSSIVFIFAIIATSTAMFIIYNNDYKNLNKYIILDISTLIFFISNIVGGVLIELIALDADIKLLKKINKPSEKIKQLSNELYYDKKVYLYIFLSIIICYEKLHINRTVFMLLVFITLLSFFIKDIKKSIKEFKKTKTKYITYTLKYYFITLVITGVLSILIYLIIGEDSTNQQLLEQEPIWYLLLTSLIYAPIAEELLFRGCLRKLIKNDTIFILVSGISFGLWHVIGYDQSLIQYLYAISYSAIGIGISYVYAKTNNLTTNISMHFIHNTIASIVSII